MAQKTAKLKTVIEKGDTKSTRNGNTYTGYKIDLGEKYPQWVKQWADDPEPFVGQEYELTSYDLNGDKKWEWKAIKGQPAPVMDGQPISVADIPDFAPEGDAADMANTPTPTKQNTNYSDTDILIVKQTCIKAAADLYSGTGEIDATTSAAKSFFRLITQGEWN